MDQIEKELKIIIPSGAAYTLLTEKLGLPDSIKNQVNYYFDDGKMTLLKNKVMARVRIQNSKIFLTLKSETEIKNGFFQCAEFEEEIFDPTINSKNPDLAVLSALAGNFLANKMPRFDQVKIHLLGKLENARLVYEKDKLFWEIDHSIYTSGKEDYEIEVESEMPELVEEKIRGLFKSLNISFAYQTKTKFERFLKDLNQSRK